MKEKIALLLLNAEGCCYIDDHDRVAEEILELIKQENTVTDFEHNDY